MCLCLFVCVFVCARYCLRVCVCVIVYWFIREGMSLFCCVSVYKSVFFGVCLRIRLFLRVVGVCVSVFVCERQCERMRVR